MNKDEKTIQSLQEVRCPNCDRKEYRFRRGSKDYLCRICGTVFEAYLIEGKLRVRIKEEPV